MKTKTLDISTKASILAAYNSGRLVVSPQYGDGKKRLANLYCVTPAGKLEAVALDVRLTFPWLGASFDVAARRTVSGILNLDTVKDVTVLGL